MKKVISLKPKTIIEIIAALFILLFIYTALSKSLQIESTINVLNQTPVFSIIAQEIAWGIVISEFIVSLLLFLPRTRITGLYCSGGLILGFTGYIAYMMAFVPDLPCSCGGVISEITWTQHLILNIFFLFLAVTALFFERKKSQLKEREIESTPIVFT